MQSCVPALTVALLAASACTGTAGDAGQFLAVATPPSASTAARPVTTRDGKDDHASTSEVESRVGGQAIRPATTKKAALELTFVGDVIFGRYRDEGFDPIAIPGFDVFGAIRPMLAADLTIANLETPLVRTLPAVSPISSRFRFGASMDHARLLVDAGFTAVSLANNHWFDMREEGVQSSPEILRELGIVPLGSARDESPPLRIETVERHGWRIGFVATTAVSNAPVRDDVPKPPYHLIRELREMVPPLVARARENHDLVIVLVHWGDEYLWAPSPIQTLAAHEMVDAGADLVIGHHPHVLQAIEAHGRGLVAYSLGNFLFESSKNTRLTGVLRTRFRIASGRACLEQATFHPAYVKRQPTHHPVPAKQWMGEQVRRRVVEQARALGTAWDRAGEDLVARFTTCVDDASPTRP